MWPGGTQYSPPLYLHFSIYPPLGLTGISWLLRKVIYGPMSGAVSGIPDGPPIASYPMISILSYCARSSFFTSFHMPVNPDSSYCIGPLFGATMSQVGLPSRFCWLFQVPHPLISAKRIRWSVENLVSLTLMLYKKRRSETRIYSPLTVAGLLSLHTIHVPPYVGNVVRKEIGRASCRERV